MRPGIRAKPRRPLSPSLPRTEARDDPPFDPTDPPDPETLRRILLEFRVAVDDIDGVVLDMLTKKRRRSLGRAQHKRLYRDARKTLIQILDHLMPPPPPPPH
jgi:hypothetical protein